MARSRNENFPEQPAEAGSELYDKVGIHRRWHHCTLDGFVNDPKAKATVLKYLDFKDYLDGVGIYLYGPRGHGKTHLATVALRKVLDTRVKVEMIRYVAWINTFQQAWSDPEQRSTCNYAYSFKGVLLVDNLFARHTDYPEDPDNTLASQAVQSLLETRFNRKLPTWITATVPPEDFAGFFGDSSACLIRQNMVPIEVSGEDFSERIQEHNLKPYS